MLTMKIIYKDSNQTTSFLSLCIYPQLRTCLYNIPSIFPELTSQYATTTTTTKKGFWISSVKQKEDLEQQKQLLSSQFPTYELTSNIKSRVNFKQPGHKTLLERTSREMVSEIVVTYRLCCFTFNLVQYILF